MPFQSSETSVHRLAQLSHLQVQVNQNLSILKMLAFSVTSDRKILFVYRGTNNHFMPNADKEMEIHDQTLDMESISYAKKYWVWMYQITFSNSQLLP